MVTHEKFQFEIYKDRKKYGNARWARSQRPFRTSASLVITLKLIDCAQSIKILTRQIKRRITANPFH